MYLILIDFSLSVKAAPLILEKILDRHERSGIAVQWNGGGGGVDMGKS